MKRTAAMKVSHRQGSCTVPATWLLREYAAELKGATAGRGRYELEFSHYEPVPPPVQKQLIEAYKPRHDED